MWIRESRVLPGRHSVKYTCTRNGFCLCLASRSMSLTDGFPAIPPASAGTTTSKSVMETVKQQTCWASTVGTLHLLPSSLLAPLSISSSPQTTHGKVPASPCAMRSTRQVSVWVSACLPDCLTQLSSSGHAFDHLFNVISSKFSGDKGLFFFFFF